MFSTFTRCETLRIIPATAGVFSISLLEPILFKPRAFMVLFWRSYISIVLFVFVTLTFAIVFVFIYGLLSKIYCLQLSLENLLHCNTAVLRYGVRVAQFA